MQRWSYDGQSQAPQEPAACSAVRVAKPGCGAHGGETTTVRIFGADTLPAGDTLPAADPSNSALDPRVIACEMATARAEVIAC